MMKILPEHNFDVGNYQENMPLLVPIVDALIILISLFLLGFFYWQENETSVLYNAKWWLNTWRAGYINLSIVTLCFYFLFALFLKIYRTSFCDSVFSCMRPFFWAWAMTVFTLLIIGSGAQVTLDYSRLILGSWFLAVPCLMFFWRVLFVFFIADRYTKRRPKTRTVVIGLDESARSLSAFLHDTPHLSLQLVGYYDDRQPELERHTPLYGNYLGSIQQCIEDAKNDVFDLVYLCMPLNAHSRVVRILEDLADTTVSVFYLLPQDLFFNALKPTWHTVAGYSAISIFESPHVGFTSEVKRAEDIILSSLILVLIAVPMLLIAALVKVTSQGPVFFKQRRYGLSGREFQMLKFRSMTTTDDGEVIKQAVRNDPRLTTIGRYLRKFSLDELPQFINVFKGDMSVVGPRPHAVAHNEEYRKLIPGYMLRHKVKPGITGLAQINGCRGETETTEKMEKRVKYDLEYIKIWSLGLDIRIIVRTLLQGVTGKNVY
ncbi:MAG: undecaprenyl-phosphate glucose phosphotransferase [Desulfobulbus propionicus]|nr:MAG: undecaprenyl-phosphate glucose phosphotransferase [Desulfobulbus propionicus]